MSDCVICGAVDRRTNLVYEDDLCIAFLPPAPAVKGHIALVPKNHYQILEQIPDYEIAQLFQVANKLSIAVFESLKVQGTNILVQNGVAAGQAIPHVSIHIIPRGQGDKIDFQWKPKQLTQEQMSAVELKLKKGTSEIAGFQVEKPKTQEVMLEKKEPEKIEEKKDKGINYLIRQFQKVP